MWGFVKRFAAVLVLVGLLSANATPAQAAIPGSVCPKADQTLISGGKLYTCIKSGSKLVWNAGKSVTQTLSKTPTPSISGSAVIDETLVANAGVWDSGVLLSYQWLSGGAAISGANDRTYVPSQGDLGRKISVRVTGSKDSFRSVSKVSAQTAAVKAPAVTVPTSQSQKVFTTTSVPKISGTPKVGGVLTATVGKWDTGVTFRYQWIRNNVAISGANSYSYVPTADDVATFVTVAVTGSKTGYRTVTQVSDVAFITASVNVFPSVSMPQIQGSPIVGSTLAATISDWGVAGVAYSYQWIRSGKDIPGATSTTFRLTAADVNSFVGVRVTGSKSGYLTESRTNGGVGPVQNAGTTPLLVFVNASDPEVTGSLTPGSTLTESHSSWDTGVSYSLQWYRNGISIPGATTSTYLIQSTDVGKSINVILTGSKAGYISQSRARQVGIVTAATFTNTPTPTIEGLAREGATLSLGSGSLNWSSPAQTSIQWLKNGVAVSGATSSSLALSANDIGSVFTVAVTGAASGYSSVTKLSAPTAVVTAAAIVGSKPTISGISQVGQTLTANAGYWESGVALAYKWLRNGSPISGATSSTYVLVTEDNATQVSVEVTGTKAGLPNLVQTSTPVAVTTTILTLTPVPTISGTPQVGQTLTADAGAWDSGVTLSYSWLRNGTPITGANSNTWTLKGFNAGATISVMVTGSKPGFVSVSRTSTILNVPIADFTNTANPTITGNPVVGAILQANDGSWELGTYLARQWLKNGVAIVGATGQSYVVAGADSGSRISYRITASLTGYNTVSRDSSSIGPIQLGVLTSTPTPTIATSMLVNGTYSVTRGAWDTGTALTQQWMRDGVPIAGAIGTSYTVTSADFGTTISVSVTGSKTGYSPVTKVSGNAIVSAGSFALSPAPTISGTGKYGQTLTANTGTWDTGTTFTYQWLRAAVPIAGATQKTYIVALDDISTSISVTITASKTGINTVSRTSSGLAISAGSLTLTPTPSITGVPTFGRTLTGAAGSWDADASVMYQWLRNGAAISGATGSTYVLTAQDVGASISFSCTGSKPGFLSVVKSSATLLVSPDVLTLTPAPTISGLVKLDQSLVAEPGTWDTGATFAYQWFANGVAISSAVSKTFTLGVTQVGQVISVRVTGTKPGFGQVTKESAPTTSVIADTFASQPEPFATYNAQIVPGATMFANAGDWGQGAVISYQWMYGTSNPITGATSQSYLLTDQWGSIYLQITVKKPGVIPVTKISGRYDVMPTGLRQLDVSVPGSVTAGQTITLTNVYSWIGPKRWRVDWKKNGTIFETTASADSSWAGVRKSYVTTQADIGSVISVAVTYGDFTKETAGCTVVG